MRRFLYIVLVLALVFTPFARKAAANYVPYSENVKIVINGKALPDSDGAYIDNNRTMMPLRVISEDLGYEVNWNSKDKTVTIMEDNEENFSVFSLKIGSKKASHDSVSFLEQKEIQMEVAPVLKDGKTFIPVRDLANLLSLEVQWDGKARTVYLKTK